VIASALWSWVSATVLGSQQVTIPAVRKAPSLYHPAVGSELGLIDDFCPLKELLISQIRNLVLHVEINREDLNNLRPTLSMDLRDRLRGFGKKYGFVPYCKSYENLSDDFAYIDPAIKDIGYQVKGEIEDYYAKKEGVIPFFWHKIRLYPSRLPCRLEYVVDRGRKVLKDIRGVLGRYAMGLRNVYINDSLPELENGRDTLKYTLKHELFHSVQDELGSINKEPHWRVEAEASIFAVDGFEDIDFERTEKGFAYRNWTLDYIRRFGKILTTTFKKKLRQVNEYFTPYELSAIGLEAGEE
jgi:hypothetical protein